jgi:hypothetical protein
MLVEITLMNKRFLTHAARVRTFSAFHFWTFVQSTVATNRFPALIMSMLKAFGISSYGYFLALRLNI